MLKQSVATGGAPPRTHRCQRCDSQKAILQRMYRDDSGEAWIRLLCQQCQLITVYNITEGPLYWSEEITIVDNRGKQSRGESCDTAE